MPHPTDPLPNDLPAIDDTDILYPDPAPAAAPGRSDPGTTGDTPATAGAPATTASAAGTVRRKFRKRPVVIEAEQFDPFSRTRAMPFADRKAVRCGTDGWYVTTAHGQETRIVSGDWIIPEPDGRGFYPVKPDIFAATYEPVDRAMSDEDLAASGPTASPPRAGPTPADLGYTGEAEVVYWSIPEIESNGEQPDEVAVLLPRYGPTCPAGLIVYGKYRGQWFANAGDRYVVRALLSRTETLVRFLRTPHLLSDVGGRVASRIREALRGNEFYSLSGGPSDDDIGRDP